MPFSKGWARNPNPPWLEPRRSFFEGQAVLAMRCFKSKQDSGENERQLGSHKHQHFSVEGLFLQVERIGHVRVVVDDDEIEPAFAAHSAISERILFRRVNGVDVKVADALEVNIARSLFLKI